MKQIIIPIYNIVINIVTDEEKISISGNITSELHEDGEDDELYNAAMDGIESMILAHAIAGIDVTSPAYIQGIETAVNACANNI